MDQTSELQTTPMTERHLESPSTEQTTDQPEEASSEQKSGDHHNGKVNGVKCWPERVVVTGPGLAGGSLGKDFQFHIDARNGGPGVLTACCQGNSGRAPSVLQDRQNGIFSLVVQPEEVGKHVLDVEYQDEPVAGSPFTFHVLPNSSPDATKVRVSGTGVENGILSNFQSKFVVDTLGAGAGHLSVRMQGPRGAFQMEMHRASPTDRQVLCHYNPTFTGLYIIFVKWSGEDVPGSPFHVKIFESEFEMEKDVRGHS